MLVAVVGATVVSAVLDLARRRRRRPSGSLPAGRAAAVAAVDRASATSARCWSPRSGITLVSLTDTIATATTFAARRGDEVEPDQEMIGMGAANIAAALFQGFAVSTSGSRTAVAEQSGAKSQVTGLVGAGVVVRRCCSSSTACWPTSPSRPWPPW